MGEEPGKSEAAENSRGAGWPSTRTGSNGGGRETETLGREGDTGRALCEALEEVLPSPCQNYALKFMSQDTQGSKEKHMYFKRSCHFGDKRCRRLFVV